MHNPKKQKSFSPLDTGGQAGRKVGSAESADSFLFDRVDEPLLNQAEKPIIERRLSKHHSEAYNIGNS